MKGWTVNQQTSAFWCSQIAFRLARQGCSFKAWRSPAQTIVSMSAPALYCSSAENRPVRMAAERIAKIDAKIDTKNDAKNDAKIDAKTGAGGRRATQSNFADSTVTTTNAPRAP